jgi:ubiquinone/menaquinone biosynthesis C-methylase UbiE
VDTEALKARLGEVEKVTDEEWINSLDERKRKELEFHDMHRDRSEPESMDQDTYKKLYRNRKFYAATKLSKTYVDCWIAENARGKVFLDYACGNGFNAIKAAEAGAKLAIGIDISRVSVENARRDALEKGVSENTRFVQADAENTKLPDNCVDAVICSGMLHHLDLSQAFPELERILAPGGKILAVEALDYNPAIKLYRLITPEMRTEWEKAHILSLRDVRFARKFFDVGNIKYWHITSILAPYMGPLLPALNRLDRILTKLPLIQLMAWVFTFELVKKPKQSANT